MFCKESIRMVENAIEKETEQAKKVWGDTYNSKHEAYAILKEEVEEVNDMNTSLDILALNLWKQVKNNGELTELVKDIKNTALFTAMEAVQVASVCNKFLETLGVEE